MADAANSRKRVVGTPFKKGVSGNPTGRPKSNLNKLLSQYLFKKPQGFRETYGELLVRKLLKLALEDGDLEAVQYIWERLEGKIPHGLDVASGGAPIKFTLNLRDEDPA